MPRWRGEDRRTDPAVAAASTRPVLEPAATATPETTKPRRSLLAAAPRRRIGKGTVRQVPSQVDEVNQHPEKAPGRVEVQERSCAPPEPSAPPGVYRPKAGWVFSNAHTMTDGSGAGGQVGMVRLPSTTCSPAGPTTRVALEQSYAVSPFGRGARQERRARLPPDPRWQGLGGAAAWPIALAPQLAKEGDLRCSAAECSSTSDRRRLRRPALEQFAGLLP